MAKVAGLGGYWVVAVDVGPDDQEAGQAVVHNSEYEYEVEGEIDDTTDSTSDGFRQGLPVIKKVTSATLRVAADDTAYPEALGLIEGNIVDIWMKRGELDAFDKIVGAIVRRVRNMNPQDKARRVEITTEYGSLVRNATAPAAAPPPPVPTT